jgi:hypothetical protein
VLRDARPGFPNPPAVSLRRPVRGKLQARTMTATWGVTKRCRGCGPTNRGEARTVRLRQLAIESPLVTEVPFALTSATA